MAQLPNDEPGFSVVEDNLLTQRIAADVTAELRRVVKNVNITTGKITRAIADRVKDELRKVDQHEERLDKIEKRQGSVSNALKRGLTQVIKLLDGD